MSSEVSRPQDEIAVFSYNRPALLANLLNSLEMFRDGAAVTIWDDGSDDRTQVEVLRLAESRGIRVRTSSRVADGRHGSLYQMMSAAIADASERGVRMLLMLQDDVQLLRPVRQAFDCARRGFVEHREMIELGVMFDKMLYPSVRGPECDCGTISTPYGFSDIGIVDVSRLVSDGVDLLQGEYRLSKNLADRGMALRVMSAPVAAYVPWPVTFREGTRRMMTTPTFGRSGAERRVLDSFCDESHPVLLLKCGDVIRVSRHPVFGRRRLHELNVRPIRWIGLMPYGFGENGSDYLKGLLSWMKQQSIGRFRARRDQRARGGHEN